MTKLDKCLAAYRQAYHDANAADAAEERAQNEVYAARERAIAARHAKRSASEALLKAVARLPNTPEGE